MSKKILANLSTHAREQLLELEKEKLRRDISPLKLYKPYDYQLPFHQDTEAYESVVLGGNRSGKTTACAMEFCWAITGTHPVPGKYSKENGLAWIVGQNWSHIGRVIVPMLLRSGVFKIIRDLDTGLWRAFDFVKDAGREDETKPAPPLIPERLIKQKSWVLKSANMPSTLELTNGWVINLFSSDAEPPQGNKCSMVWIDEDINSSGNWVTELQARLADLKGRLMWSAMPHSRTDALVGLADRAEKAAEKGDTRIKLYRWRFLDNVAIPDDQKQLMIERWAAAGGEEEVRRRAEGEFADDNLLVYPNFNLSVHSYDPTNGQIPSDWCRYMVVDPGHAVCAVIFAAVPPDGSKVVLYDELYIRNASATILAEEVLKKVSGQTFHAFIIDAHGARLTDIGSGKSPQIQYSEAFAKLGIQSTATGHSFIPGCDDIAAGIQAVREAMYIRQNGECRFKIVRNSVPNLIRELKRYKFKVSRASGTPVVTDTPNKNSGDFHLVDNLRYLFSYDPEYHKPPENVEKPWWWDMVKKRQREKNRSGSVYLAPQSYSFSFDA